MIEDRIYVRDVNQSVFPKHPPQKIRRRSILPGRSECHMHFFTTTRGGELRELHKHRVLNIPSERATTQQERVDIHHLSVDLENHHANQSVIAKSIAHVHNLTTNILMPQQLLQFGSRASHAVEVELIRSLSERRDTV